MRPSCLIIDEVGHCEFDKENTRLFFDLIDRRYNKDGNFNEDDALLYALDRIFDDATVFNIKGERFRGKQLETVALQTSILVLNHTLKRNGFYYKVSLL